MKDLPGYFVDLLALFITYHSSGLTYVTRRYRINLKTHSSIPILPSFMALAQPSPWEIIPPRNHRPGPSRCSQNNGPPLSPGGTFNNKLHHCFVGLYSTDKPGNLQCRMLCLKYVENFFKCSTSACVLAALFESCAHLASDVVVAPDATQVWSLTQLSSVDF